jgi:hypothetical protein
MVSQNSFQGYGMLPGDIVWDFIKKIGKKLKYEEGYVIPKGAEGFQCKDCNIICILAAVF